MQDSDQSRFNRHADGQYQHPEHIVRQDYHVRVEGGQKFVVPNAVEVPLAKTQLPDLAIALDIAGGPGVTKKLYSTPMAGGLVEARIDPGHSERERHLLHAEVKALQDTFGISYKDAAHRLFLAEVERVKRADSAEKSFAAIGRSLRSLVTSDIIPPIDAIDKGKLDQYVWKNGKWVEQSKQSESWE